jgi:hypothetical protein|tara:strand:+ start:1046 stop:1426 length:381 start_codon:yes stop_codon:yes gene_type:complete
VIIYFYNSIINLASCVAFRIFQGLLSLEIGTSGAVIAKDEVQLKLGASTVYTSTSKGGLVTNSGGYSIIDRRWSVIPTTQPSNGNLGVRSYFTATEVSAVNTALGSSSRLNYHMSLYRISFYQMNS